MGQMPALLVRNLGVGQPSLCGSSEDMVSSIVVFVWSGRSAFIAIAIHIKSLFANSMQKQAFSLDKNEVSANLCVIEPRYLCARIERNTNCRVS
jgi:hypothetical protein